MNYRHDSVHLSRNKRYSRLLRPTERVSRLREATYPRGSDGDEETGCVTDSRLVFLHSSVRFLPSLTGGDR